MRRSGSVLGLPRGPRPWSAGTGAAVRIHVRVDRTGRVAGTTTERRAQQWKQYEPASSGAPIGWLSGPGGGLGGAPEGRSPSTVRGTCVLVGEGRTSRVGATAAALVSLRDRQRSGCDVTPRDLGTERHPYRSDITLRSHGACRLSTGPLAQVGHFGLFPKDALPSGSTASYVRWIGNRPRDPFQRMRAVHPNGPGGCRRETRRTGRRMGQARRTHRSSGHNDRSPTRDEVWEIYPSNRVVLGGASGETGRGTAV